MGDNSFVFTRNLTPNRLLNWRDVARRPLVRKGEMVEVAATEGTLLITLKGLAMENGAQGDTVTVRNLESKRDIHAQVGKFVGTLVPKEGLMNAVSLQSAVFIRLEQPAVAAIGDEELDLLG